MKFLIIWHSPVSCYLPHAMFLYLCSSLTLINGIRNVKIFAPYKMDKASSCGTEYMYILYKVHVYKTWIPMVLWQITL
jgi:hypothetical protein